MIQVIEDFLPNVGKCSDYISELLVKPRNNFSLNFGWEKYLHGTDDASYVPSPILIHHLEQSNHDYCTELKNDIDSKLIEYHCSDLEVDVIIFHIMTHDAFIDWHSDIASENDRRKGAITIYLNREWGLDKGGEFLYNIDNKVERVTPSFNKAVLLRGSVNHRTTPVFGHHLRKSLQVWLKQKG